jgi:hypothetical protein
MEDNKVNKVITICLDHSDSENRMPLIFDKSTEENVCCTCGRRYKLLEGVQVFWTEELHQRAIEAGLKYSGNQKLEVHEIVGDKFTHSAPLETAPKKPEPPKNFEQQLHDFVVDWKANNPTNDYTNHSRASKVLFDLYSDKAQRGWSDYQISSHFGPNCLFDSRKP